jgi:hypothetical protein
MRPHVSTAPRQALLACALAGLMSGTALAQQAPGGGEAGRIERLEALVTAQHRQIDALERRLGEQQTRLDSLGEAVGEAGLQDERARGAVARWPVASAAAASAGFADGPMPRDPTPAPGAVASAQTGSQQPAAQSGPQDRVGRAPEDAQRPPEIAQIFDQPGVLTPRGRFILEPSLQFGYSSNDRVALVGFTVIPAILIGLIDVRQVKTTSATATLTARYGVTNRFELEARVPYVYIEGDTVSREIFTGSAQDNVFRADGRGLGDVELTARYQLNRGGPDRAFYVAWLRYKSRTGKDLFEVVTDCVTRCVANATGTGLPLELPTGSGFQAIQPGLTWLYPSDPVVFFGSFSYLHNVTRSDVSRTVLTGAPEGFPQTTTEFIGDVEAGDIIGMNVGVGLALNERAAISLGYDQSIVGKTKQNGEDAPGAVRVILGTLVLGGSYRFSDRASLNVALGVGVTRDTPDTSLSVRVPISF